MLQFKLIVFRRQLFTLRSETKILISSRGVPNRTHEASFLLYRFVVTYTRLTYLIPLLTYLITLINYLRIYFLN